MLKKVISVVSAIAVSAVLAANSVSFTSEGIDYSDLLDDFGGIDYSDLLDDSGTLPIGYDVITELSPGNLVNINVTDENGNIFIQSAAKIRNSAGQSAGHFRNDYYYLNNRPVPTVDYFDEDNTLGINNNIGWNVSAKTLADMVAPNVPYFIKDYYTSDDGKYVTGNYDYTNYNANQNIFLKCKGGEIDKRNVIAFLTSPTVDQTAFTIPADKVGIFVDKKWANRNGKGFYRMGDDGTKKYFSKNDMIGKLKVIAPKKSLDEIRLGIDGKVEENGRGWSVDNVPQYQSGTTGYIKWSMNLVDIFNPEYFPYFNKNGTFEHGANIYDLKNDTQNTTCILTIVSGACMTVALPDSNGNVEFYVEEKSREFSAEVCLSYSSSKGSGGWGFDDIGLLAGNEKTVSVITPEIPDNGLTLMHVPTGEYTIEFTEVPEGYFMPSPIKINVAESKQVQKFDIALKPMSAIKMGDANGNGIVDASDASMILGEYANISTGKANTFTESQFEVADVNNDNIINSVDASKVLGIYSSASTGGTV